MSQTQNPAEDKKYAMSHDVRGREGDATPDLQCSAQSTFLAY